LVFDLPFPRITDSPKDLVIERVVFIPDLDGPASIDPTLVVLDHLEVEFAHLTDRDSPASE
jgi:hypothetical protein